MLEIPTRPDGLQIDEDRAFQDRFWVLQRRVWLGYVALIVLAVLGLTGLSGVFSTAHARLGGAEVTWPRITRVGAPSTLTVVLAGGGAGPELVVSPELFDLFQIETIHPHPAMESGGNGLRMAFFPDPVAPYRITLSLRAQSPGFATVAVALGDQSLSARTVVLP